ARVEFTAREGRGVRDRRIARPAAELEIGERALELAWGRAADGRHVIEPSRRQLAEESLGIGDIDHVSRAGISVHARSVPTLSDTEKEPRGDEKARTGRASQVTMTVVVPWASRKRRLPR